MGLAPRRRTYQSADPYALPAPQSPCRPCPAAQHRASADHRQTSPYRLPEPHRPLKPRGALLRSERSLRRQPLLRPPQSTGCSMATIPYLLQGEIPVPLHASTSGPCHPPPRARRRCRYALPVQTEATSIRLMDRGAAHRSVHSRAPLAFLLRADDPYIPVDVPRSQSAVHSAFLCESALSPQTPPLAAHRLHVPAGSKPTESATDPSTPRETDLHSLLQTPAHHYQPLLST